MSKAYYLFLGDYQPVYKGSFGGNDAEVHKQMFLTNILINIIFNNTVDKSIYEIKFQCEI